MGLKNKDDSLKVKFIPENKDEDESNKTKNMNKKTQCEMKY